MSHAQFVEAMAVASALNTLSVVVGILIDELEAGRPADQRRRAVWHNLLRF